MLAKAAALLVSGAVLAACAGPIAEREVAEVSRIAEPRTKAPVAWMRDEASVAEARTRTAALLSRPVGADDAVEIAFLNNRRLQADLADLGLAAADLAQAWRLPNPGFSFKRLDQAGLVAIERKFTLPIADLVFMPLKIDIERSRLSVARLNTANGVLRLAADVRRAWFGAVAAAQAAAYAEEVREATAAGAELARRMAATGNLNALDTAREQAFHADATADLARARRLAEAKRERLVRLLGLWGTDAGFTLPARLPDLPAEPVAMAEIEAATVRDRLDIRARRAAVDSLATSLGLTRATGFVNVLDASYIRETGPRSTGYEITLEIPVFDWGDAKVARAEALYAQAADRLAATAIDARSEARDAYVAYRTAHDLALAYRDEIVPLRGRITEEMQLRYNGMLASVFELLIEARAQIGGVTAAIAAQRDFWIADTDLHYVTIADTGPALRLAGGED